MPLHSEWPGSLAGHRGPSEKEWMSEMYLRPLAELQRWAESFGAQLKALGAASPAAPVGTLQDMFESFFPGTTGVKPDLITVSIDMLKNDRFSPEPNQRT